MRQDPQDDERDLADAENADVFKRMSPGIGTGILGGLAAMFVVASFLPAAQAILWFEIPLASLLFLGCVWIVLACPEDSARAAPGLLLAAAAAAGAWLRLGMLRDHPWLG